MKGLRQVTKYLCGFAMHSTTNMAQTGDRDEQTRLNSSACTFLYHNGPKHQNRKARNRPMNTAGTGCNMEG